VLPSRFPDFAQSRDVDGDLMILFRIMARSLKSPRPYEGVPEVVAVTGAEPCPLEPGQTAGQQVGDTAAQSGAGPALELSPCYRDNTLVIKYGPARVAALARDTGSDGLPGVARRAYATYLILLNRQHRPGEDFQLENACAYGRLLGGLRDAGYMSPAEVEQAYPVLADAAWAPAYRRARDSGTC
jgi:hypothetical protein